MRIIPPADIIDFETRDIYGDNIRLSDYRGKAVILSFFRDASCPFCLKRVFELAVHHKKWSKLGVEIVTIFSSTQEEILSFNKNAVRRSRVIADPNLEIYGQYGIEHSLNGLVQALLFRMPTIINGFKKGARPTRNPNGKIMPADFLIDSSGTIVEAWYGDNASGHIPMARLEKFVKKTVIDARTAELKVTSGVQMPLGI